MANDITLGEFLAQAQRSMGGGAFGRVSGPLSGYLFGPDFFRKQTYLQIADTFTATYGKKVWDALNNKTVLFNAIKKVDWGPTVGWRLRSDRGANRSRPATETGSLPTIDVSKYEAVFSNPKTVASTFGVSLKAQAVSALEGGIGNQLAVEQEATSRDHIKEINQELLLGSFGVATAGAAAAHTLSPVSAARNFRPGDTCAFWKDSTNAAVDDAAANNKTVSGFSATFAIPPDPDTGVVTVTVNWTQAGANNDVLYIKSRAGVTSLSDLVMQDASLVVTGTQANKVDVDAYNLSTRTASTYASGASVSYNSGAGRDLSISLMDAAIRGVRQNGGEPKLIVMGLDQYDKLNQLLQAQQRFMDYQDYVVGAGDERTYPGTKAGFQLATYKGIPVLPDPDTCTSFDSAVTTAALGTDVFVLDTDYLEIAVMYPTQYLENRDYFAANALVMRGMFFSVMELRSLRLDVHSRISNLNS